MRKLLFAFVISVLAVVSAFAQTAPKPAAQLSVENGDQKITLTVADLAKMQRREIKARVHDTGEHTFSGVELREILKKVGIKFGTALRGPGFAQYVLVEAAADDYKVVIALVELDDMFTDKIFLLADTIDGKPLDDKNGPLQIIIPDEKRHGRWVRQVTKLTVRSGMK